MIRINKTAEPNILTINKANWTAELLGYINRNEKVPSSVASRYNQDDVKQTLRVECKHKCMYCESAVAHVSYEHIEHIKPKAKTKFPELTYEWTNLGLACPVCNMNKGDEYDVNLPIINPYIENPSDFIFALGHFLYNKPASAKAELTRRQLKLNRPELLERRQERLESIIRLINRYHAETNPTLKNAIWTEIDVEVADDKPYSLCAKSIYDAMM
ncbi:HNH endonuclease [Winogradskyella flava]|uniref:HNH endonuclease n=1 Tax=Winogradskyella flava TaxID=1884876 RepID=UPI002491E433|nr:HNH endonuclease [Winogradskyella flava]